MRRIFPGCLLAAFWMCGWLYGCGTGSSSNAGAGGGGGGAPVGDTQRSAVIQNVENKAGELARRNLTRPEFNRQLREFMATQTVFVATGVDAESSSVWGVFTDGRMMVVANNRDPQIPIRSTKLQNAERSRATAFLPTPTPAHVLHSFGPNFEGQAPVTDITGWLNSNGYTVANGREGDARVSTLKGIAGGGFFYFNTHGGRCYDKDANSFFSMQSSTLVDPNLEATPEFKDDLDNQRLVYFTARNGETRRILGIEFPAFDTRYGITYKFVQRYMSFGKNSVLFFNVCFSAATNPDIDLFINACATRGAGVYLGWTKTVSAQPAYDNIRYFADRLLGANQHRKESPDQRAFDWKLVLDDMKAKGLAIDPAENSMLVAKPAAGGQSPHLLVPSIEQMYVDESNGELILAGSFGDIKGKVTVDSVEVAVNSWGPERIVCRLPATGAGSAGDVQASLDNRKSNVRRITEWQITGRYRWFAPDKPPLQVEGPVTLRFRADVGTYRTKPGETPRHRKRTAYATKDSKIDLTASGTHRAQRLTTIWSGQGVFPSLWANTGPQGVGAWIEVDTQTRAGFLGLTYGFATSPFTATQIDSEGRRVSAPLPIAFGLLEDLHEFSWPTDENNPAIPIPALRIQLNADFSIPARTYEDRTRVPGMRIEWSLTPARFAPDPNAARSVPVASNR